MENRVPVSRFFVTVVVQFSGLRQSEIPKVGNQVEGESKSDDPFQNGCRMLNAC